MSDSEGRMLASEFFAGAGIVLGIVVALCAVIWTFGQMMTADDWDTWDKIDSGTNCYVHVVHHENGWLTPGRTWVTRTTFCKADLEQK